VPVPRSRLYLSECYNYCKTHMVYILKGIFPSIRGQYRAPTLPFTQLYLAPDSHIVNPPLIPHTTGDISVSCFGSQSNGLPMFSRPSAPPPPLPDCSAHRDGSSAINRFLGLTLKCSLASRYARDTLTGVDRWACTSCPTAPELEPRRCPLDLSTSARRGLHTIRGLITNLQGDVPMALDSSL